MAVARVLDTFITTSHLSSSTWQSSNLYALLFQNCILEERLDIRTVSYDALLAAFQLAEKNGAGVLRDAVEPNLSDWYQIVMTPPGAKIEPSLLTRVAKASNSHNVDRAMMEGDLSLTTVDTVMETRLLGAKLLARVRQMGSLEVRGSGQIASPPRH